MIFSQENCKLLTAYLYFYKRLLFSYIKDEIRFLKQKLKETEMNADKDRYLRDKINEDSSHLVRENATLSQQVLELQKQLERVRLCVLMLVKFIYL